ncbi:GspE/PulE family protein [Candidatus Kaiserbacteria bacterium]|nr:GspE/PulE family protein [Candidatus Kaiserbacteria bacterium]
MADDEQRADVPARSLGDTKIPYDVLKTVPEESAEHYSFAPLGMVDDVLEVGMVDPGDIEAIDALNFIARSSGIPYKVFKITKSDFEHILTMYRGLRGEVAQAVSDLATETKANPVQKKQQENESAALDLEDATLSKGVSTIQEDAPAIKIVSTILRYAIDGKASDVHIEPLSSGVRVRYRVDGELHTSVVLPISTHRAIVARIKVLSSIRLDERRKPQDGRFSATIDNRQIDFRVSTFPAYNGEKVVIRILDREQGFIPLDQIGLTPRNLETMRRAISQPHGLILISGPTGSGKSTTLYSMLSELDREHKNVLSLEDPIEYFVDGIIQSQVHPEIGYTFASGLRTTLRQDPDVIMVGEIRDGETAKLAIQAALTGHLVLSTIHTNDAIGTIPRLIDMGVEPYLIPPVLICSIAQRLVRTFCPGAEVEVELGESAKKDIATEMESLPEKYRYPIPTHAYEAQKTPTCPTGMRGRMAVFEVLEMTPRIERIVLANPVESTLWTEARAEGMLTMREDAMMKVMEKKVPFSEINSLRPLMLAADEEQDVPQTTTPTEDTAV